MDIKHKEISIRADLVIMFIKSLTIIILQTFRSSIRSSSVLEQTIEKWNWKVTAIQTENDVFKIYCIQTQCIYCDNHFHSTLAGIQFWGDRFLFELWLFLNSFFDHLFQHWGWSNHRSKRLYCMHAILTVIRDL